MPSSSLNCRIGRFLLLLPLLLPLLGVLLLEEARRLCALLHSGRVADAPELEVIGPNEVLDVEAFGKGAAKLEPVALFRLAQVSKEAQRSRRRRSQDAFQKQAAAVVVQLVGRLIAEAISPILVADAGPLEST